MLVLGLVFFFPVVFLVLFWCPPRPVPSARICSAAVGWAGLKTRLLMSSELTRRREQAPSAQKGTGNERGTRWRGDPRGSPQRHDPAQDLGAHHHRPHGWGKAAGEEFPNFEAWEWDLAPGGLVSESWIAKNPTKTLQKPAGASSGSHEPDTGVLGGKKTVPGADRVPPPRPLPSCCPVPSWFDAEQTHRGVKNHH